MKKILTILLTILLTIGCFSQDWINNGESGLSVRTKLNNQKDVEDSTFSAHHDSIADHLTRLNNLDDTAAAHLIRLDNLDDSIADHRTDIDLKLLKSALSDSLENQDTIYSKYGQIDTLYGDTAFINVDTAGFAWNANNLQGLDTSDILNRAIDSAQAIVADSSKFIKSGNYIYLKNSTDSISLGDNSPSVKFEVNGDIWCDSLFLQNLSHYFTLSIIGRIKTDSDIETSKDIYADTLNIDVINSPIDGDVDSLIYNTKTHIWNINGTPKMRLNSSGLGIGTTNPQRLLHIHESSGGASILQLTNVTTGATATDGVRINIEGDESVALWNYENTDMRFGTNALTRMTIQAGGNVGIGTTSPTQTADINGDLKIRGDTTFLASGGDTISNSGNITRHTDTLQAPAFKVGLSSIKISEDDDDLIITDTVIAPHFYQTDTIYLSFAPTNWTTRYPDIDNIDINDFSLQADADNINLYLGLNNLPNGYSLVSLIVYGNAGATAEIVSCGRASLSTGTGAAIFSTNIGTVDDTPNTLYNVVDNSNYSYYLGTTTIDTGDEIYGTLIKLIKE